VKAFVATVEAHWDGVIAWQRNRLSNGLLEGTNSLYFSLTEPSCFRAAFRSGYLIPGRRYGTVNTKWEIPTLGRGTV
jgi:hypothetical protein